VTAPGVVDEVERTLRIPLGDPGLRIGCWRPGSRDFAGADQQPLQPQPGQTLTEIERDGEPAVAILHDVRLADDQELLAVAGQAALLALEHAELTASRSRLMAAVDRERRGLERDLHDGAQQRLMAIQIKVRLAQDRTIDEELATQLEAIGMDAELAVAELRSVAQSIYPPGLRAFGLADALRSFAMTAPLSITVDDEGLGRCARAVEAAIYFCATEAVQHFEDARVTITLGRDSERVRFAITTDGVEMEPPIAMHDRIGAVGGELEIVGHGTTMRGSVPL
jgi:signal transduction histidine kinase